jgi:hypothetical protein
MTRPTRSKNPLASREGLFQRTNEGVPELQPEPKEKKQAKTADPTLVKRTYYVPKDLLVRLTEVQVQRYRATGEKPELSDLVAEALANFVSGPAAQ